MQRKVTLSARPPPIAGLVSVERSRLFFEVLRAASPPNLFSWPVRPFLFVWCVADNVQSLVAAVREHHPEMEEEKVRQQQRWSRARQKRGEEQRLDDGSRARLFLLVFSLLHRSWKTSACPRTWTTFKPTNSHLLANSHLRHRRPRLARLSRWPSISRPASCIAPRRCILFRLLNVTFAYCFCNSTLQTCPLDRRLELQLAPPERIRIIARL